MNDLYPLLWNLKEQLDQEPAVKDLIKAYQELKQEKILIEKIKKYHQTEKEEMKKELIQTPLIRSIKEKEGNLNYLILDINQNLEKIMNGRGNKNESN